MRYPNVLSRTLLLTAMVILTGMFLSCENKVDLIPKSDFINLPSVTVKNSETVYTDSGLVQLIVTYPLLEQYDTKDNSHADFKFGINLQYYDGQKNPEGYVTSKYATYTKNNNLWELRDSVVVVNKSNDRLETEILFWDQEKDLIYTDRFVKITNKDEIIQGFGLESDAKLIHRRIKKVTATIYLRNEE